MLPHASAWRAWKGGVLPVRKWIAILLTLFLCALPVSAKQVDYVITGDGIKLPITVSYRFQDILSYVDSSENPFFKNPNGLYVDGQDNVYVSDTGNNRVVKFNKALEFVREYTLADTDTPLKEPQGLYVDDRNSLYIADTGNNRVVHIAEDGHWIENFTAPDSSLFDYESYGFSPTKVTIDNFGYLCILNGNDYHGIIKLDAHNRFVGYYGTNKVTPTLGDYIIRYFGSEEQKEQYMKKQPPYITGMYVDDSGYTYTTNALVENQEIKKLDQSGSNTYASTDSFVEEDKLGKGRLEDIHVSDDGIVTVVDSAKRKIYQYDSMDNMLCAFGEEGDVEGTFGYPVAVSADSHGNLYVLDRDLGNVQIFQKTEFMQNVHDYLFLYKEGRYDECAEKIQAVLQTDSTYLPAYHVRGKLLYKDGQYQESMEAYAAIHDMKGYSDAFDKQRQIYYRQYFVPILIGIVLLAVGIVMLVSRTRRWARRKILDGMVNRDA